MALSSFESESCNPTSQEKWLTNTRMTKDTPRAQPRDNERYTTARRPRPHLPQCLNASLFSGEGGARQAAATWKAFPIYWYFVSAMACCRKITKWNRLILSSFAICMETSPLVYKYCHKNNTLSQHHSSTNGIFLKIFIDFFFFLNYNNNLINWLFNSHCKYSVEENVPFQVTMTICELRKINPFNLSMIFSNNW